MKVFLTLVVVLFASLAQAQTTQVVVLRNGNVLEGQVDRLADGYYVTTSTSEFRLAARDVERISATLQDAYAAKRAEVRENCVTDHLILASWCMQQEMWVDAGNELNTAKTIDARNPQIAYLERRLEVVSSSATREVAPQPEANPNKNAERRAAELARLEAIAAELPPGSLEDFARHVQPILVNGCASGGCHSSKDQREFRLNRDLVHGVANRESTLRNLEAVLQVIDERSPEYSPLLLQPAVPHGGLPRPVFSGPRQRAQERLVEWVKKTTGTEDQPDPAAPAVSGNVELAGHEAPATAAAGATAEASPAKVEHFWEDPAAYAEGAEAASAADIEVPTPKVQYGTTIKRFEPRDEFDPELFNRQTGSKPAAEQP
ncbi:hypothetical protein [Aeoliella mucimassa]|uniref:SLA1 homology domain-containing protein n=1 Tax=Aeoliella mucimassa TaxID=2527972 RepID=A0A518AR61_9BACT|nr:hypothetical protein [Aeoliella mucimassa]QDU57196.1 hypothetical protein Pan181_34100 [Aeoliella mucimassa]